jgi:hypothetical protein
VLLLLLKRFYTAPDAAQSNFCTSETLAVSTLSIIHIACCSDALGTHHALCSEADPRTRTAVTPDLEDLTPSQIARALPRGNLARFGSASQPLPDHPPANRFDLLVTGGRNAGHQSLSDFCFKCSCWAVGSDSGAIAESTTSMITASSRVDSVRFAESDLSIVVMYTPITTNEYQQCTPRCPSDHARKSNLR